MRIERQAILESATRLLAVNPRASTGEIAAAAGISRATLHRQFPSREALIEAIGLLAFERINAAFVAARLDEGSVPEALARLIEAVIPAVHQFAFLVGEGQIEENETLMDRDLELQVQLEALLRRGQAEGAIRYDMPAPWLAYALSGLLLGAEEAERRGAIAPRDTSRLVLESFLAGAAAPLSRPNVLVSHERTNP